MKKLIPGLLLLPLILSAMVVNTQTAIRGAWHMQEGPTEHVLLIHDGYLSHTSFDKLNKKFLQTHGGSIVVSNGSIVLTREFHTARPEEIGKSITLAFVLEGDKLQITHDGKVDTWTRVDDNKGDLAGVWRITARMRNGQMSPMNPGPRKTLKILTGTRFQWVAINPETKEFFGTGGGTYTFTNGIYTENIEFFPRDNNRVGASLSFEGSVAGNTWTHKGKSSSGDPLQEEWTRQY
jgi:hypothetical protein